MKKLIIVLLISGFLYGCKNSSYKEHHSIVYKEKSEDFERCVDGSCANVVLSYPVFEGDTVLAESFNTRIEEQLTRFLEAGDRDFDSPEAAMDAIFNQYVEFKKDFPDDQLDWTIETKAKVTYEKSSLVTVKFENYSFLGGAHPNSMVLYLNIEVVTGETFTQEKLLKNREQLLQMVEEKFRGHHGVRSGVSLEDDGRFFLDDGNFFLPAAMGYEGNEFVLIYNSYEIAPYVMGRTELRFPLEELEGIVYWEE
jgi:hypothetical protein